jgi:hypothetical protein
MLEHAGLRSRHADRQRLTVCDSKLDDSSGCRAGGAYCDLFPEIGVSGARYSIAPAAVRLTQDEELDRIGDNLFVVHLKRLAFFFAPPANSARQAGLR